MKPKISHLAFVQNRNFLSFSPVIYVLLFYSPRHLCFLSFLSRLQVECVINPISCLETVKGCSAGVAFYVIALKLLWWAHMSQSHLSVRRFWAVDAPQSPPAPLVISWRAPCVALRCGCNPLSLLTPQNGCAALCGHSAESRNEQAQLPTHCTMPIPSASSTWSLCSFFLGVVSLLFRIMEC